MGCPFKCLNLFNRKKEITFYSRIPHGDAIFPIKEAGELDRQWKQSAKEFFIQQYKNTNPAQRVSSSHRCPGIRAILDLGFIVSAHRDFNIETTGDGQTIKFWESNDLSEDFRKDTGTFLPEFYGNHASKHLPVGANKSLLKLSIPWNFIVPKDVVFLVQDIPYKEDNRFQTVPGILDPYYTNELTFIFYWFVNKGIETIKRGTPLAQIIPIKRSKPYSSWSMQPMTEKLKQKFDIFKYVILATKITNYDKLKQVSKKLFNY